MRFQPVYRFIWKAAVLAGGVACSIIVVVAVFFDPLVKFYLSRLSADINGSITCSRASLGLGKAFLTKVKVRSGLAQDVFSAKRLIIELKPWRVVSRGVMGLFGDVKVERPGLYVLVDPYGTLNLKTILPSNSYSGDLWLQSYNGKVVFDDGFILYRDERASGFLYQLHNLQGKVQFTSGGPAVLTLTALPDQAGSGAVAVSGKIGIAHPLVNLGVRLGSFDLAAFNSHPAFPPNVSLRHGDILGELWIKGEAESWGALPEKIFLGGKLDLQKLYLEVSDIPWPIKVSGSVILAGKGVQIQELAGNVGDMPLKVKGSLLWTKSPLWTNGQLVTQVDLKTLRRLFSSRSWMDMQGKVQVDMSWEGTLRNPRLEGAALAKQLNLSGTSVQDLRAMFTASREGIRIRKLRAFLDGGRVLGDGWVFRDPEGLKLSLHLTGEGAPVWRRFGPLGGTADFSVTLLGDLSSPVVFGKGQLSGLRIPYIGIGSAGADFLYGSGSVVVWDGRWHHRTSRLNLPFGILDLPERYAFVSMATGGFTLPTGITSKIDVKGKIAGNLTVWGDARDLRYLRMRGELKGGELKAGGFALDKLQGDCFAAGGRVYFPELAAVCAGGKMRFAGWVDPWKRTLDLALLGDGIDLSGIPAVSRSAPGLSELDDTRFGVQMRLDGGKDKFLGFIDSRKGAVAGIGYRMGDGRRWGAVAFLKDLELSLLPLKEIAKGRLSAMGAFYGNSSSSDFLCSATVAGKALGLDKIDFTGNGSWSKTKILLKDWVLSWDNPSRGYDVPTVAYSGHAYSFFGPLLSRPLEAVEAPDIVLPRIGSLALQGSIDYINGALDLHYRGRGLELGWVASRPVWPGGRTLNQILALQIDHGLLFGEGEVKGVWNSPEISGAIRVPWLSLRGESAPLSERSIMSLAGRVGYSKDKLYLDPLIVSGTAYDPRLPQVYPAPLPGMLDDGLLTLKGKVALDNSGKLDFRVWARKWPVRELLGLFPRPLSSFAPYGSFSADAFHVWGDPRRPALSGKFALIDGGVWIQDKPLPLQRVVIDFSSQGGTVRIGRCEVESGPLKINGRGYRNLKGDFRAAVWSEDVPLGYLGRWYPPLSGLSGSMDLALETWGNDKETTVYLGTEARNIEWDSSFIGGKGNPFSVDRVVLGKVATRGEELVPATGSRIELRWSEGRIRVSIPQNALFLTWGGKPDKRLSLEGGMAFALPEEGERFWDWFMSPSGPDFGSGGYPLKLVFKGFDWDEVSSIIGLSPASFRLVADFALSLEGQWWRGHALESLTHWPNYLLKFSHLVVSSRDGRSGLELMAPWAISYGRKGHLTRLDLEPFQFLFFHKNLGKNTKKQEKKSASERALGADTSGRLSGEGKLIITSALPGQDKSKLRLTVSDLSLDDIAFLLPTAFSVSGVLEHMEFGLLGDLVRPDFKLALKTGRLNLGAAVLAKVEGELSGRPSGTEEYKIRFGELGSAAWKIFFGDKPSSDQLLTLDGGLDMVWDYRRVWSDGRLHPLWEDIHLLKSTWDLQAVILDRGLNFIATILPGKEKTGGVLRADLKVTGDLSQPELAGTLAIQDGRIDSSWVGSPITDLNVDILFEKITADQAEPSPVLKSDNDKDKDAFLSRYLIRNFKGLLGGKPFEMTGKAELIGLTPSFLNVHFGGLGLPVVIGELFSGVTDVDLYLRGRIDDKPGDKKAGMLPVLTGMIRVLEGDLDIPLDLLEHKRYGQRERSLFTSRLPILYDLDLDLGDDVWVNILSATVRVQGQLKIVPNAVMAPVLEGGVFLTRGTIAIPLYEAAFRIRQGYAYFEKSLSPVLDNVEADTDLGGYRITARFDGQYPDSLRTDFVSDPPLPQAELGRLIVLGGLPGAFSGIGGGVDPNNFITSQGVALLSGLMANRLAQGIGRLFFLSEVALDFIPPAQLVIKVAKAIDSRDRVLLTLTRIQREDNNVENLYGVEWRFQPNLLVRVARDNLDSFRFWFQSLTRF